MSQNMPTVTGRIMIKGAGREYQRTVDKKANRQVACDAQGCNERRSMRSHLCMAHKKAAREAFKANGGFAALQVAAHLGILLGLRFG